jgi:hypothetical protein
MEWLTLLNSRSAIFMRELKLLTQTKREGSTSMQAVAVSQIMTTQIVRALKLNGMLSIRQQTESTTLAMKFA